MTRFLFRRMRTVEQEHLIEVEADSYEEAVERVETAKEGGFILATEDVIQEDFEFVKEEEEE